MQDELPLHRTIVFVDVARFSDPARTTTDLLDVHRALYVLLERAFDESGLDLNRCIVGDRGDGMLILLPTDMSKNQLADRLPGRLAASLKRHNATRTKASSFQLRVGLHAGEVRMNQNGAVSPEINFAARIVDAQDAKDALRQSNEVLAIIASDRFYHEAILPDPGANPERYRKIPVEVKETSSTAWLLLPDAQLAQTLFPRAELEDLEPLLTKVTKTDVPQLLPLLRRASGRTAPLVDQCVDAWQAFTYLMELNAGGDGFPPAVEFVQLLARHVHNPLQADLVEWVTRQVQRLGLESVQRTRQGAVAAGSVDSRLHLLIMVQHDGIDPERFLLSYWQQEDSTEWPPARGETREVTLAELEYRVDELIVAAERAWSGYDGTVVLEFLLPRALLGLPVHRWYKEYASGLPKMLCADYPIVVRSLERMASTEWHRVWRKRWRTMVEDPAPERVHFCQPADLCERNRLDAILSSPQWTLMVLSEAPSRELLSSAPEDELTAALRAGIPALIWHPQVPAEGLREIVSWLVEGDGMGDLPARAQTSRLTPFGESPPPFDSELARGVVILWDDPGRMVFLDQPMARTRG